MKRASFLVAVMAFSALTQCAPEEEAPKILTPRRTGLEEGVKYREKNNLAALAHGAVVTHRTAEAKPGNSAVHIIDSFPDSSWVTPPRNPQQSATIALAAPARISHVGITTRGVSVAELAVRKVKVELSNDGVAFHDAGVIATTEVTESTKLALPAPSEARFVRFSLLEGATPNRAAAIASVEVNGSYVQPPATPDMTGRWEMPGGSVVTKVEGSIISGRAEIVESDPMLFSGRVQNGVALFSWTRGPEVGFGALAVQGDTLNAVLWHEKPISFFIATSWVAERKGTAAVSGRDERGAVLQFLRTLGRYPAYPVAFGADGKPLELVTGHIDMLLSIVRANPQHPFIMSVMSPFNIDENVNERASATRAAALRSVLEARGALPKNLTIVSRGSHYDHDFPSNELDRLLYDRFDLELGSFDTQKSIQTLTLR
jgi:hypothetical protein